MKKQFLFPATFTIQVLAAICLGQTPTFVWNNQYNAYTEPWAIREDNQKNILVAGLFMTTVDFDPGPNISQLSSPNDKSIFIQKLDSMGNHIWIKHINNRIDSIPSFNYSAQSTVDMISDNDGNIYITSAYSGNVDFDPNDGISLLSNLYDSLNNLYDNIFISKYSSNGEFIWVKRIELGYNSSRRIKLFIDDFNYLYLVGDFGYGTSDLDPGPGNHILTSTGNNYNNFLIKLDSSGSHVYSNLFPINTYSSIFDFPDPNCFVDKDGSFLLSGNIWGQTSWDTAQVIDIDPSNLILNVSASGMLDGIFAKYDSVGNLLWYKQLCASVSSRCKIGNLVKSDDGNIFIWGSLLGTVDFDPSVQNYNVSSPDEAYFFAKYSSDGDLIWVKLNYIMTTEADFELLQTQTLNNGSIIFCFTPDDPCSIDSGNGNISYTSTNDFYGIILILDSNGNYQWSKQYHEDNRDLSIFDSYVNSEDDIFFSGIFQGTVNFATTNNVAPLVCQSCSSILPSGENGWDGFLVKYKFSGISEIDELHSTPKSLIKILDLMGRETTIKLNEVQFYQFSDGSVEKKVIVEK
jgi:hypothetical protein